MLTKQQIKDTLKECKDEVVIGLWNQCARDNRYEEVFINDVGFFFDCIVRGWNHWEFAEAVLSGDYRIGDIYAWFNSNYALMSFNRPCDELSPVDYGVLASFIHERYDLTAPNDLFDIEINNEED